MGLAETNILHLKGEREAKGKEGKIVALVCTAGR